MIDQSALNVSQQKGVADRSNAVQINATQNIDQSELSQRNQVSAVDETLLTQACAWSISTEWQRWLDASVNYSRQKHPCPSLMPELSAQSAADLTGTSTAILF